MNINLSSTDSFATRHIGPNEADLQKMLHTIGVSSLDELIDQTVPSSIRLKKKLDLPPALSEFNYLRMLRAKMGKNKLYKNFIGMGYYGTVVPPVIQRNILENPGWYTQYTPYQAEIAQGRLEALLNFQTMVSDLTGLEIANASLLDEGTAAGEAMIMLHNERAKREKGEAPSRFLIHDECLPQTIDVLRTRALPLGIEPVIGNPDQFDYNGAFAVILQYPTAHGAVLDYSSVIAKAKAAGCYVVMAVDLMALALLTSPGELGADVAIGNSQRFGVPMGYGGPHAAFFATRDEFKRQIPGRIIGVSADAYGKRALRMALQTREQHIKREKATSNICTAQALLAIMAGMYGAYHGPQGIRNISLRIHTMARLLSDAIGALGIQQQNAHFFDTLHLNVSADKVKAVAEANGVNFCYTGPQSVTIAIDETTQPEDLSLVLSCLAQAVGKTATAPDWQALAAKVELNYPKSVLRTSSYLTHPVFNSYHSESEMMRYIKKLENKDLSLTTSMISLGSCTMKLNAAAELMPVSWPESGSLHPFAPADQVQGYLEMVKELENYLSEITGFTATSLQPNSGAQGEYAGLLVMRAYHHDRGDTHRTTILIPSSAHGTNPASAVMAGLNVVVVKCDSLGNIDVADLRAQAAAHKDKLFGLMVTYPSTHGVFEETIIEVCQIIHDAGGLVYMDGANMNAQVGLTCPAAIGADVCHLNLHKTFAIPHGGGGPGMGPICVNDKLAPYLPGHPMVSTGGSKAIPAVSAAPFGSASILLISYGYIRMLGPDGVTNATKYAILNANYMKARLSNAYQILYVGSSGRVAHEFIMDIRPFKATTGIEAVDVAKRLMDYSYHAPTVSFPVAGTLMIEPTESESLYELDRFCDALLRIRGEIQRIEQGEADKANNVLKNAPHTADRIVNETWEHPYSRHEAVYPLPYLHERKFWPSVSRINDTLGDRNLICVCPPIEEYMAEPVA
jgi:glycine dehydrogenase